MRHTVPAVVVRDVDPAASVSLAAILDTSVTQTPLGEWLQSPTRDIHARLVHFASTTAGPAPSLTSLSSSPPYSRSLRSSSSMAPACVHQSNASTQAPSLYHCSDATPTEESISTGLASGFSGVRLLEEVNGVLERPPSLYRAPVYECTFWFLRCSYLSRDDDEWKMHCLSHFRGEEPPRSVYCPLCDDFRWTCDDGWRAWNVRMDHIALCHHMAGETLKTSRPDFRLYQHLWQKKLIDNQDLKELKGGNHNLTRTPPNFVTTNRRHERTGRGQRAQHVG